MKELCFRIEALSPLHLGAGKADVVIDAEVVHDKNGLPYFPGKRLKGLLYESALELAEISNEELFTFQELKEAFGHGMDGQPAVAFDNLYLDNYERLEADWAYLFEKYNGLFTPKDVLESYTELRYATMLDKKTGTAKDGSLRNIRLVDAGTVFVGKVLLLSNDARTEEILRYAAKNLRYAGAKRNRGCGFIKCEVKGEC